MSKKIIFILLPVLALIAAGTAIYFDSISQNKESNHHHSHTEHLPDEPKGEHLERILEIEETLQQLDDEKLSVAFLGEIVQINIWYDRFDGAGDATQRIARITNDPQDWKDAGDYYFTWLDVEERMERRLYFAAKSVESYKQALKFEEENPDILTDIGIVYANVSNADTAISYLERALSVSPDHLYANFNLGVIFHETGNKNESISYLKRSLELAYGTEHETSVNEYIQQVGIEI